MVLISIILALIIERLGARANYWQVDYYMQQYYQRSQKHLQPDGMLGKPLGFLLWLLLPVVAIVLLVRFSDFVLWHLVANICVLLVAFGCAQMRAHYKGYLNALSRGDNEAATLYALQMGQRRTEFERGGETFGQTLAWLNFRHYCAVIFWFVILGAPGAILYAVIRTVADWVYHDKEHPLRPFKRGLQRTLFWLDWLPARVASFGFLIIGNFSQGTSCWLRYLLDFKSCNRKVVTSTALAAEQIEQQHFGCTYEATCMMRLVKRNILFYLVLIALLTLFGIVA
ncbi:beta-lactamase regulator AmpE [Pseudoalteromonas fenneropenaei]|uniref:Beta-lactamase regulator AmpE n=1 Tax=Pseudoalteromonas fenneropenaei TaxID=1737459 RepID=A0ABV7CL11_9GAMM